MCLSVCVFLLALLPEISLDGWMDNDDDDNNNNTKSNISEVVKHEKTEVYIQFCVPITGS